MYIFPGPPDHGADQEVLPRSPGYPPMKHLCKMGHNASYWLTESMQASEAVWASRVVQDPLGKVGRCQERVLESWGPGSHRWFSEAVTLRTSEDVVMPSCCFQHLAWFPPSTLSSPLQLSFLKVSHLNAAGFHLPPGKYGDFLPVAGGLVLSLPPSAAYMHSSQICSTIPGILPDRCPISSLATTSPAWVLTQTAEVP